ncbi:MAG: type II toxin-antitoxin system VapC family toxin [Brevundimonas sp.]
MIVLDTHVLVWALSGDPRLGPMARSTIDEATSTNGALVSAITPWEIAMLVEKGRLALGRDTRSWIKVALANPGLHLTPIEPEIAIDSVELPGAFHADPADRFIVATARSRNAVLLTADRAILNYALAGHLKAADASL